MRVELEMNAKTNAYVLYMYVASDRYCTCSFVRDIVCRENMYIVQIQ